MGAINWFAINPHLLGQLLTEICDASRALRLKLPASVRSVNQQLAKLIEVERQLLRLQQRLTALLRRSFNPAERRAYRALLSLVRDMRRVAQSLQLLAEEYPLDPDGAAACLEVVEAKETGFLKQVDALSKLHGRQASSARLSLCL